MGESLQESLVFVIGPPRSGSTMLQRMLASHSQVATHPEPHLVTPLAHLGIWATVERAPYDHINAALAQREFVAALPGGEQTYWAACRAYLDGLYGPMLEASGKRLFVDKTPANALVLPFLTRVYPRARYLVLTRHPLAVFCSYVNSFFEGDAEAAVAFNDILGRYVPAMAAFLRQAEVPRHHLTYEELVRSPEVQLEALFDFLGLPHQPDAVDYGDKDHVDKSLGDPKVRHHKRPTTDSLMRWAADLAAHPAKLAQARQVVATLSPADLAAWGVDKRSLFDPVRDQGGEVPKTDLKWVLSGYRLRRRVFLALRKDIHRRPLGKALKKVRYYCDVLLRE